MAHSLHLLEPSRARFPSEVTGVLQLLSARLSQQEVATIELIGLDQRKLLGTVVWPEELLPQQATLFVVFIAHMKDPPALS